MFRFSRPESYAWLSIVTAILTVGLKALAYYLTGSVGLLSDAIESLVNLLAAIVALVALSIAARPPDSQHAYGHGKAEYFSSIAEGLFIFIASGSIAYTAIQRILHPLPLELSVIGIGVSVFASLLNLIVALSLFKAGTRFRSITLTSDAHHLMTDVWTSVAVVGGIVIVMLTGIQILDPIIALIVSVNIVFSAVSIIKESALGFMDTAISDADIAEVTTVLNTFCKKGVSYHGLRTRQAGARRFVTLHVLVPGNWSVKKGHDLLEKIEQTLRLHFDKMTITTHLEPSEDPISSKDISIDRE